MQRTTRMIAVLLAGFLLFTSYEIASAAEKVVKFSVPGCV